MVVLYIQPFGSNQWEQFRRTEVVTNSRNPDFTTLINIVHHFEEHQKLKFEVHNMASSELNQGSLIGSAETTLGNLVSKNRIHKKIEHQNDKTTKDRGTLIISSEELASSRAEVEIQLVAHNLEKMKYFFGKSDPFVTISKSIETTNEYDVVHRTEVSTNTLNPVWKKIVLPVRNLNNGDYERTLRLDCWHWNQNGTHNLIGQAYFSLQKLLKGPLPLKVPCINPEKKVHLRLLNLNLFKCLLTQSFFLNRTRQNRKATKIRGILSLLVVQSYQTTVFSITYRVELKSTAR